MRHVWRKCVESWFVCSVCTIVLCNPVSHWWAFSLQQDPWMRLSPPVLLSRRAAIPLSFLLILRLCGATPVAALSAFCQCPLRLLDDLHALFCRSCESPKRAFAPARALWEFACWRALEPGLEVLQRRWGCMGRCARIPPWVVGRLLVVSPSTPRHG